MPRGGPRRPGGAGRTLDVDGQAGRPRPRRPAGVGGGRAAVHPRRAGLARRRSPGRPVSRSSSSGGEPRRPARRSGRRARRRRPARPRRRSRSSRDRPGQGDELVVAGRGAVLEAALTSSEARSASGRSSGEPHRASRQRRRAPASARSTAARASASLARSSACALEGRLAPGLGRLRPSSRAASSRAAASAGRPGRLGRQPVDQGADVGLEPLLDAAVPRRSAPELAVLARAPRTARRTCPGPPRPARARRRLEAQRPDSHGPPAPPGVQVGLGLRPSRRGRSSRGAVADPARRRPAPGPSSAAERPGRVGRRARPARPGAGPARAWISATARACAVDARPRRSRSACRPGWTSSARRIGPSPASRAGERVDAERPPVVGPVVGISARSRPGPVAGLGQGGDPVEQLAAASATRPCVGDAVGLAAEPVGQRRRRRGRGLEAVGEARGRRRPARPPSQARRTRRQSLVAAGRRRGQVVLGRDVPPSPTRSISRSSAGRSASAAAQGVAAARSSASSAARRSASKRSSVASSGTASASSSSSVPDQSGSGPRARRAGLGRSASPRRGPRSSSRASRSPSALRPRRTACRRGSRRAARPARALGGRAGRSLGRSSRAIASTPPRRRGGPSSRGDARLASARMSAARRRGAGGASAARRGRRRRAPARGAAGGAWCSALGPASLGRAADPVAAARGLAVRRRGVADAADRLGLVEHGSRGPIAAELARRAASRACLGGEGRPGSPPRGRRLARRVAEVVGEAGRRPGRRAARDAASLGDQRQRGRGSVRAGALLGVTRRSASSSRRPRRGPRGPASRRAADPRVARRARAA